MELVRKVSRHPSLRGTLAATARLIRRADAALARNAAWIAACLALLGLQAALILTHEPWLDEYQALQLAVQAPDIATLLDWLRYEGHPPLWYLILRGLAYLMEPLAALPAAALILAAATQAAILFASPFSRTERLLIAASEFILFDFLTLSRSMNLGVMLIVLALALWRSRWCWLMIAALPMCDFLFGVLSGVLVLLKAREKRLYWPGVVLWLAVGALAAWTVRPAPDIVLALADDQGLATDLVRWLTSIGTLAIPFQGGLQPMWNAPVFPLAGILWIVFLWFAWVETRDDRFHRLMLFGFIGLTFVFSLALYPLALRHLMLIALLLICLTWLRRLDGGRPSAGFRLWIGLAALCGVITAAINFAVPFNTAHLAAAEIWQQGLAGKHWMVFPDSRAQGVSAIIGIDFERTERRCMQSFIRWDYRTSLRHPRRLERYLRGEVERNGRFYLLSDLELTALPPDLVRPITHISGGYHEQEFHLYEVGPGRPEARPNLPPCVPDRRPLAKLP